MALIIEAGWRLAQIGWGLARAGWALAHTGFLHLLPSACAFCASSSSTNKAAYIGTTLLLLGLPVSMLGALIVWLIRRAR